MCCLSVFGDAKKTSANNTKAIVEKIRTLEVNTQEQFVQVQMENQALKEQLLKMESEIALYREDVRAETSRMNENMSNWLTILTIVIGVIAAALGVAAPLYLNKKNDERQQQKLDTLQNQIDAAREDAKSAKQTLTDIEKLKNEITSIKQTIETSEIEARKSAEEAKVSKLFAEALAEHENNPQKALDLYNEAINLDKLNARLYNNRGIVKSKIGDVDGAMMDYAKAIELIPNDAMIYNNRGCLYAELNKICEAIEDFNKALELNPKSTNAYGNRAKAYLILAENTQDEQTKKKYATLAEVDKKKYAELNNSDSTKS